MKLENNFHRLYNRLFSDHRIQIQLGGSEVDVHLFDKQEKMSLTATVYEGENFIPHSVRKCVHGKVPFEGQWIPTKLVIHEDEFKITLVYVGEGAEFNPHHFKDLLEEFSWQADEWRLYLEEHDKHDLVHIYSRK